MPLSRGSRFPMFAGGRPPTPKAPPSLGVGSRAHVMCSAGESAGVTLTDDSGTSVLTTVADGAEVEILAWRPRRGADTRYRVVSTGGGIEGWLGAKNLRPRAQPVPSPKAPASAAPVARIALPARTVPVPSQHARRSPAVAAAAAVSVKTSPPKSTKRGSR